MKSQTRREYERQRDKEGWESLRRGLPDDFLFRINPRTHRTEVAAVILNSSTRKLRSQQAEVMGILNRAGIACFQWDLDNGMKRLPRTPSKTRNSK